MRDKYPKLSQTPGFLLWKISIEWQRLQREALANLDLTHVQFVLLATIHSIESKNEMLSQVKLSSIANVDAMMTSHVLRSLEKRNLVKREKNPSDTRAMILSTTQEGRDLLTKALKVVEDVDSKYLGRAGEDTADLVNKLKKLTQSTV
ncbi:MAG: MarR family winged helix-turn-helix transcriptional regulator [Chlamydiia bacterium]